MTMAGIYNSNSLTMKGLLLLLSISLLIPLIGCEENGGNSAVDPNEGADSFVTEVELDTLPCNVVRSELDQSLSVQCIFTETQYPLSMSQFMSEINDLIGPLEIEVNDDSRTWLESLGARGGMGDVGGFSNEGGPGGGRGYARTATTIGNILDNLLSDGDSLYILVGQIGSNGNFDPSGGGGGASTVVIGKEITDVGDPLDPEGELVLLIAGGGGGGGGGGLLSTGRKGGDGGDAISSVFDRSSTSGESGGGGKHKGRGGNSNGDGNGGDGSPNNGTGGIGGEGGFNDEDRIRAGWGIEIDWTSGRGGNTKNRSLGGGGGGGFGGGGGANTTASSSQDHGDGAGGGGSWARISTVENSFGRFLGKDNMPSNDDNGSVVMTMETFSN